MLLLETMISLSPQAIMLTGEFRGVNYLLIMQAMRGLMARGCCKQIGRAQYGLTKRGRRMYLAQQEACKKDT